MNKININLYSRQISTYGLDIMIKINNMKVIILGMGGLGVEIAKNIILTGVSEISFFDDKICSISDLSSNFYISEEYIKEQTSGNVTIPEFMVKEQSKFVAREKVERILLEGKLVEEYKKAWEEIKDKVPDNYCSIS
jgi:molybdopterin/thiamine biosynthesis adenylyltransferase